MGLYKPNGCCICFDTKNGSLIQASLILIYAILRILIAVGCLFVYLNIGLISFLVTHQNDNVIEVYIQSFSIFILSAIIITIVWNIFLLTISCFLIHGVRRDVPELMLPFLAWSWFQVAIDVILGLFVTGMAFYLQEPIICIVIVALVILVSFEIYSVLVVNAYHKEVKQNILHQSRREELDNNNVYKNNV